MKGQVRDFQDRMSAQNDAPPTSSPNGAQPQPKAATEKKGDYIDFEEVK
jgi:hypothetical protein